MAAGTQTLNLPQLHIREVVMISQRGLILSKRKIAAKASLDFTIEASEESPLLNPAIIVRNWGKQAAELRIDGRSIPEGKNFRQGIVSRPDGDDLIIWLRMESKKQMDIKINN